MRYPVTIEPGTKTTAWGVVVPDLPGCFSAGDTLEDALIQAEDAITGWIETAIDDGQEIPALSHIEALRTAHPEFEGWLWALVSHQTEPDHAGSSTGGGAMTLYAREDSPFWWVRFSPIRGELKPYQKSTETKNKRQAQQYHDKLQSERWEQDKLGVKHHRTWDDAAAKWLLETSHKRTHEWDKSMLRWFQPFLGGKDLTDINRALLDHVREKRGKGVCASTVNRYMALVRAILRKACNEWEWIDRAPKVSMLRDKGGRIRSLSRDEFTRLLAELPPHLAEMARFSVATGLRQANVTRLQWRQISLERRHLWVGANQYKNGSAHSVPLNQAAMDVLERRRGDHLTYVFTYDGKPVVQVNTKAWHKALDRAGIQDFRWHDLRHTFATWHREAGTPTHELQRLGGWKTQSMVERYAHVAPEGLQFAASRLDGYLGTKGGMFPC